MIVMKSQEAAVAIVKKASVVTNENNVSEEARIDTDAITEEGRHCIDQFYHLKPMDRVAEFYAGFTPKAITSGCVVNFTEPYHIID